MENADPADAAAHRASITIELLRIGVGLVWALNFVFIVSPANNFFGGFGQIALSFAPTTLGGPALAQFVATHAILFSWLVAVVTGYLAFGLILGLTTRWVCLVGGIFSAVLLGTQIGSTFVFPGGTDIGEHPLYLLIYIVLVFGGAGQAYSMDHWIAGASGASPGGCVRPASPVPRRVLGGQPERPVLRGLLRGRDHHRVRDRRGPDAGAPADQPHARRTHHHFLREPDDLDQQFLGAVQRVAAGTLRQTSPCRQGA